MEATPIIKGYLETSTKFLRRHQQKYCVLSNDLTSPATNIKLYKDEQAYKEAEDPTNVIKLCRGMSLKDTKKTKENKQLEIYSENQVHKLWCPDLKSFDLWVYHIKQSLHENSFLIKVKKRELPPTCLIKKEESYQTEITKNTFTVYVKNKCLNWNFCDIKKYSPRDVNGVITLVFGRSSPTGSGSLEFVCNPITDAPQFIYCLRQSMLQSKQPSNSNGSRQNSLELPEGKTKPWNTLPDPPQQLPLAETTSYWKSKSERSFSTLPKQPRNVSEKPTARNQLEPPRHQSIPSDSRRFQDSPPRELSWESQRPSYDIVKERRDAWKCFGSSQELDNIAQSVAKSSLDSQCSDYDTAEKTRQSWKKPTGSLRDLNSPTIPSTYHQQKSFPSKQGFRSAGSNTYDRLNHFGPQNQQTDMYAPLTVSKPSEPMLYENYPITPPLPENTHHSSPKRKQVTQTVEGGEHYASFSCSFNEEETEN